MALRVVGAGLPRTGTTSLKRALEHLLGGRCDHMAVIPGHPFDLGDGWNLALAGGTPDWDTMFEGYNAAVDWQMSMFWREWSAAYKRHNAEVRKSVPAHRLLDLRVADGWEPICQALGVPVPDNPFPWTNKREDWGR